MRTESGARLLGQRARNRFGAAFVALAVLASIPLALAQDTGGPAGAPWRDADTAAQQLADAQVRVLDARSGLVAAEQRLVDLIDDARRADEQTLTAASGLQQRLELATDLAVETYISGGALTDALYLLDAGSANDFAYRSTVLSESAVAVLRTTLDYVALRSEASALALGLADEIAGMDRAIELAVEEIASAEIALDQAEWVMSIAEINRAAGELIERYGRTTPTEDQWERLRFCEATGNYAINTGNGFYGAYQFNISTWIDMGGSGLPSDASPEEQDARANYLYGLRGSGYNVGGPWPNCGRHLPS